MRMNLIEMQKSVWQLSENDFGIAAVHQADVIPFKRIHKAFSDPVRLRAAHWRMNRLQAQCANQSMRFMGPVSAAIVAQELQLRIADTGLTKPSLDRFHQHVAYGLTRQASLSPGTPRDDFTITAVLHEHASDDLSIVASDLETIRTPALIWLGHGHDAVVNAAADAAFWRLRQQQAMLLHYPIKPLVVDRLQAHQSTRSIHQGASPAIAVSRQCRDFGAHRVDQDCVGRLMERLHCAAINPVGRARRPGAHMRARHAQRRTDRLHWPSLSNKGERAIHFFSRANSTASFRISASIVFLPSIRCRWAIWARAAASSLAGTTDSPAETAVSAPSRSSLRQLNSWLAPTPCLRATSETVMPGSYVSRTSAAFSSADQRRRRSWLIVTTSIVCLFLVICTVLFLSVRITHRLCPVNQGAISNQECLAYSNCSSCAFDKGVALKLNVSGFTIMAPVSLFSHSIINNTENHHKII